MFQYLGNERLQLWFFSPNVCASFLILSVMLTIGLFFITFEQKNASFRAFTCFLFALINIQLLMIAMTYSRGGYLACFTALSFAFIISRKRWSMAFIFIFILTLLLVSDGSSRVKSMGDLGDGSIRNRFLLWKGGTGIIADNSLAGIGAPPAAGNYYTQWYQPLWLNEHYNTLISDYLTIAASYGIFVLFLILTVFFFLLYQCYKVWRVNHNMMLLYCMCAIVGYMISALFSTCYRFGNLLWLLFTILLITMIYIIYGIKKYSIRWKHYDFWLSPIFSLVICLGIIGCGIYVNMQIPYSINHDIIVIDNQDYPILELQPKEKSQGTLIFLVSNMTDEIRLYLRPAVNAGYKVKAIQMDLGLVGLKNGLKLLPHILSQESNAYLVGAETEEAILALAIATRLSTSSLSGVVVHNIPYEWPFEELSPKLLVSQLKIPLFLLQNKNRMHDGKLLAKICNENNISIYFEILDHNEHGINQFLARKNQ